MGLGEAAGLDEDDGSLEGAGEQSRIKMKRVHILRWRPGIRHPDRRSNVKRCECFDNRYR